LPAERGAKNGTFLSTCFLSRQAWDKHRESTQKRTDFISQEYLEERKQFKRAMSKLDGQVEEIINARREAEADKHGSTELPQDLLDFFLRSEESSADESASGEGEEEQQRRQRQQEEKRRKPKVALSRQVIVDNIKTFLFAGHDTTASAISWALYLVSKQCVLDCSERTGTGV
jgi:cytochrome P450